MYVQYVYTLDYHTQLTGHKEAENPRMAICNPSGMNGITYSPSLESRYKALRIFKACTEAEMG